MNSHELEPSVEAAHLRHLLDTQPGCLMRLGADGTVLAASEAALALLGATSSREALGRDFALWVAPEQREGWRAFSVGVIQGAPASIECDITSPSGERHPALLRGVPLADHPDGVASMVVAARVISVQRRLEAAIEELRQQLSDREAERVAAEAKCARALADVQQLEVALSAFADRQQQMSAERAGFRELEAARAALQAELEEANGHRLRLEAALEEAGASLARQQQREQDVRAERDALEHRLGQAIAAGEERETAFAELQTAHERLAAAHAAATAERDRLVYGLREHMANLDALANGSPRTGDREGVAEEDAAPGDGGEGRPA